MKIEKISDNQIKCTLTRSDLASRQLKLGELAYGTEKAKGLFQDMMEQANLEFGFDASEKPLMIEAIPVSMDCIILMITKVDNPDEVDTKFSGLSNLKDLLGAEPAEEDELPGCVCQNQETDLAELGELAKKALQHSSGPDERLYSFSDLETVIEFAHNAKGLTISSSSLYRSPEDSRYYLHILGDGNYRNDFSRVCGAALEFGRKELLGYARAAYMDEHFDRILPADAIEKLAHI